MLTLVWRPSAREDLRGIISYIAERNEAAATSLAQAIESCAERLPDHPFLYRKGRLPGTREAVVHPNFIVVYRVTVDAVEILNVVHARQQFP